MRVDLQYFDFKKISALYRKRITYPLDEIHYFVIIDSIEIQISELKFNELKTLLRDKLKQND
jgi:hypothetical protein